MLRAGPIPAFVHGVIEYLAAAVFIVGPFVLGFDSGVGKAVSIVVGLVILIVTATSELPTSLIKEIPVAVHIALDFVLAIFLIAAPFLFRFTDDTKATALFVTLGIAHLLITIGTRFLPARLAAGGPAR